MSPTSYTGSLRHIARRASLAAALPGLLIVAAPAEAGTYDVFTCRAPDGTVAATRDDSGGGWVSELRNTAFGGNRLGDACAAGGGMYADLALIGTQPAPSWLVWRFQAPPATVIKRFDFWMDAFARPFTEGQPSHGDVAVQTSEQRDPDYVARFYGSGHIPVQSIAGAPSAASFVQAYAGCVPAGPIGSQTSCSADSQGAASRFNIYRASFRLEDRETPGVTNVSGDAVSDAVWTGSTGLSVSATDAGGGVYRTGIEVDGKVRGLWYAAGAPCRAFPGTDRVFLTPRPCPTTASNAIPVATADLPDGKHTVRVFVEDAAGNQTTAYGPTTKTLKTTPGAGADGDGVAGGPGGNGGAGAPGGPRDPGPLNGSPAVNDARLRAQWKGRESPTRSVAYNARPTITGQLTTPTGQPIVGAFIRTTITRRARHSPAFERNSLKTDSSGRFRWKMPAGVSSQAIRLSYHQRVFDMTPVATRNLRLDVAAGLRLAISRKTVRAGQAVRLSGVVQGRPMPKLGKVVELQARNIGGRWITFKTVRSTKGGRFSAVYRFRKAGPARFQMRARARRSGDYPYGTGSSPVRRITVR
jgi:hypothetical protein